MSRLTLRLFNGLQKQEATVIGTWVWLLRVFLGKMLRRSELLGGYLSTNTSEEENTWVFDNVASDPSLWNTRFGPWIGGYQNTSSPEYSEPAGGWSWVTRENWSYTFWNPFDPSDTGGQNHLAFGGAQGDDITSTWNDLSAPQPGGFIVEWPSSSDCDEDGIVDSCQLENNDCNNNGTLDRCESDQDGDGLPDDCDDDDDGDGVPDECDVDSFRNDQPPVPGAVLWPVSEGGTGNWYVAVNAGGSISWSDAQGQAEALAENSNLASLDTPGEAEWVYQNLASDLSLWRLDQGDGDGPHVEMFIDPHTSELDWFWLSGQPIIGIDWVCCSAIHLVLPTTRCSEGCTSILAQAMTRLSLNLMTSASMTTQAARPSS